MATPNQQQTNFVQGVFDTATGKNRDGGGNYQGAASSGLLRAPPPQSSNQLSAPDDVPATTEINTAGPWSGLNVPGYTPEMAQDVTKPPEPEGPTEREQLYQSMEQGIDERYNLGLQQVAAYGAANQRRAANINAAMGRHVGGGLAGMMLGAQHMTQGAATQIEQQRSAASGALNQMRKGDLTRDEQFEQQAALAEMQFGVSDVNPTSGGTGDSVLDAVNDKAEKAAPGKIKKELDRAVANASTLYQQAMKMTGDHQGGMLGLPKADRAAFKKWAENALKQGPITKAMIKEYLKQKHGVHVYG